MLELGSSEDFHSLRKCRGTQDSGEQDCVYDLFPHRILPSENRKPLDLQHDPKPSLSCSSRRGDCQELQVRRQKEGLRACKCNPLITTATDSFHSPGAKIPCS